MTSREAAEARALAWAVAVADRDVVVLRCLADGLSKHRVHTLTGIARTTIDDILIEYVGHATGKPVVDTAAILRAKARAATGLTSAAFDYSLAVRNGQAMAAMNAAVHDLANENHPEVHPGDDPESVRARRERADALWMEVLPQVEAMIARAKRMRFAGWSDAARAQGQEIRYATGETTP
jgi:hypothetical protein